MPRRPGVSSSSSRVSLRLSSSELRARATGLFSNLQCNDIITGISPVSIPHGYTLQKACDILVRNNIDCAPLVSRQGVISGLFSFSALPAYIVQQFASARRRASRDSQQHYQNQYQQQQQYQHQPRQQRSGSIADFDLRRLVANSFGPEKPAIDYTNLQDYVTARPNDPLCHVARSFRHGSSYVAVYYEHGGFAGLLTPSKLLRRLLYAIQDVQHSFPGRISERIPNCCNALPTAVSEEDTVFEAAQLLYQNRVKAVPVTTADGRLVGSVCLRDIYEIFRTKQQKMLSASIHDFIVYINSRSDEEHGLHAAHRHSSVAHAMQKMASTGTEQLWIVDSKSKLLGVLRVRDVLSLLCSAG